MISIITKWKENQLNKIRQKCSWPNLQKNYMQQMWDLLVECRYFKFQYEIQFSFIETSRFRKSLWLEVAVGI